MVQHNDTKKAAPVATPPTSLKQSKLEETLQEENKLIKDKPLHASKLERSLKNMEGIAKLTGSK
jgi:hypothetical protein